MEQQPRVQAPNPYNVVHDAPKPASIKVFGILDIVFGTIGLVFGGFGILFYLLVTQSSEFANEFEKALSTQYAEGYVSLIQIGACFSFILSLILITSGVGLLKEKMGTHWIAWLRCVPNTLHRCQHGCVHLHDEAYRIVYLYRGRHNVRRGHRLDLPSLHHDFPDPPERR